MKTRSLLHGPAATAAGFFAALLLFAIFAPLVAPALGAEGIAYAAPALGTYFFVFFASVIVFPAVIARMIRSRAQQKDYPGCRTVFTDALLALVIPGAVLSALLAVFSATLGNWFSLPESGDALLGISPYYLIALAAAAFRGYHLGLNRSDVHGISVVISVLLGGLFALILAPTGSSATAAAQLACVGLVLGELLSLIFLIVMFFRVRSATESIAPENVPEPPSMKSTAVMVWRTGGIAVLAMAFVGLMSRADLITLPGRLAVQGYTQHDVRAIYAAYAGALFIALLCAVLAAALALGKVRDIIAYYKRRDADSLRIEVSLALKKVLLFGLPLTVLALVLAEPFTALLFGSTLTEAELATASMLGSWGALCTLPLAFSLVSGGLLCACRKSSIALVNTLIAVVVKLLLNLLLTGEGRNAVGAMYCTLLALILLSVCNGIQLLRRSGAELHPVNAIAKPVASAVCMGAALYFLYFALFKSLLGAAGGTILSILLALIIYCALVLLLKTLSEEEFRDFPLGESIYHYLFSAGLYK